MTDTNVPSSERGKDVAAIRAQIKTDAECVIANGYRVLHVNAHDALALLAEHERKDAEIADLQSARDTLDADLGAAINDLAEKDEELAKLRAEAEGTAEPDNDYYREVAAVSELLVAFDDPAHTSRFASVSAHLADLLKRVSRISTEPGTSAMLMVDDFPRRNRMDLWTEAEAAIQHAVDICERSLPADVLETDAIILLGKARDKVADLVEREIAAGRMQMPKRRDAKECGHPWFGCLTGDCPHETQAQCNEAIAAEMGRLEHAAECSASGISEAPATALTEEERATLADAERMLLRLDKTLRLRFWNSHAHQFDGAARLAKNLSAVLDRLSGSSPSAAPTDALAEMEARKDAAYLERNQVVAALARVVIVSGGIAGTKRTAIEGWSDDWQGCVYIDTPWGQASWHYHDSQSSLFADLPPYAGEWDGHTTEEKYARLAGTLQQDLTVGAAGGDDNGTV